VCNYAGLLFRNTSELLSVGSGTVDPATGDLDKIGTWQRLLVFDPPVGPNSERSPSSAPANGGGPLNPVDENFLHVNPYPNTAAPRQTPIECEAGNETWLFNQTVIADQRTAPIGETGSVPGNQGTETEEQ
jgi:hypothetical protein